MNQLSLLMGAAFLAAFYIVHFKSHASSIRAIRLLFCQLNWIAKPLDIKIIVAQKMAGLHTGSNMVILSEKRLS